MAEPPTVERPNRVRTTWRCRCGRDIILLAAPVRGDVRHYAHFFAVETCGPYLAGDRVRNCPHCGRPLPRLTWSEFEDRQSEAFGP